MVDDSGRDYYLKNDVITFLVRETGGLCVMKRIHHHCLNGPQP